MLKADPGYTVIVGGVEVCGAASAGLLLMLVPINARSWRSTSGSVMDGEAVIRAPSGKQVGNLCNYDGYIY